MQTLGLSHPRYDHLRYAFAGLVTLVILAGNISFPVAVLTGYVHEQADPGTRTAQQAGGRR
jgi:hypothetical protein